MACVLRDHDSFTCTPQLRFACVFFVEKALFYRAIPMFLTLFTITAVSLYVLSVILKHQNAVAPAPVNLNPSSNLNPPPNIPTVSATVEEDMDIENIEEGEEEKKEKEVVVKRTNSNPHLFVRVTEERVVKIKKNFFSIPSSSKEFFEKTKVILKSSLMSLCLISTMIPQNVVVIYVFVKGSNCFNDPMLIKYGNTSGFIALTNLICYPLLVRRKLKQF